MCHHPPLSPLQLTADEIKQFLSLSQAHRTPQAVARRARIVLTAHSHPDWSSKQIAQVLELNDRLVRKWRRRWQENHSLTDAPRSRFSNKAGVKKFLLEGNISLSVIIDKQAVCTKSVSGT